MLKLYSNNLHETDIRKKTAQKVKIGIKESQ